MERKYTVSELTDLIKSALEGQFGEVVVEGEASNCKPSSAGHLYFSLKDANAVIPCVFFKGRFGRRSIPLRDGALLRVRGRLSVYPPRGAYQIVCDDIELAGEGDILLLLERRKRALAAEGLFDEERKKPLPRFPASVAVVTAKTGAVIHDIITTLRRRSPNIRVVLLPAAVQGEGASASIAARIRQANYWHLGEVLIVARGGGLSKTSFPFPMRPLSGPSPGRRFPLSAPSATIPTGRSAIMPPTSALPRRRPPPSWQVKTGLI